MHWLLWLIASARYCCHKPYHAWKRTCIVSSSRKGTTPAKTKWWMGCCQAGPTALVLWCHFSDQIYHYQKHTPAFTHKPCLSLTCVAHICQAQDTKAVVATSSQKHSAFQLCVSWLDAWRDHACASSKPKRERERERERANLPLFRHKGKPCFPMMDPSLRCCLSL
jgi:hypothetical protein